MAEATLPLTRSRALDLLAGRLRAHYGDRLHALYALSDDPYEPQGDPDALHVLAVHRTRDTHGRTHRARSRRLV